MSTVEIEITIQPRNHRQGRQSKQHAESLRRIPRITRLMALAIKFQDMVDSGKVRDYADLARLGYVTRARLTQIMNLLLLAPDIQEQILLSGSCHSSIAVPAERQLRVVASAADWSTQRILLRELRVMLENLDPRVD
jgi:hypothetical protein